jgi:hypothetical protein
MATGNMVMKFAHHRDRFALEEKVIGFEMEGASLWDDFPTVIIKSVCNYSDSHENKSWQNHCAVVAVACAKGFLRQWRNIDRTPIPISLPDLRHDLDLLDSEDRNDPFSIGSLRSNMDLIKETVSAAGPEVPTRMTVPASRRHRGDWSMLKAEVCQCPTAWILVIFSYG